MSNTIIVFTAGVCVYSWSAVTKQDTIPSLKSATMAIVATLASSFTFDGRRVDKRRESDRALFKMIKSSVIFSSSSESES